MWSLIWGEGTRNHVSHASARGMPGFQLTRRASRGVRSAYPTSAVRSSLQAPTEATEGPYPHLHTLQASPLLLPFIYQHFSSVGPERAR